MPAFSTSDGFLDGPMSSVACRPDSQPPPLSDGAAGGFDDDRITHPGQARTRFIT